MQLKMPNYKLAIGYLLLFMVPLFALGEEQKLDAFAKGNAYYAQANYKEAIAAYQQLLEADEASVAVYFNLGNAYYKMDEIPAAILNYEKAYKLAPNDADVQVNLQLANQRITDKIESVPPFFLSQWWHNFILACYLNTWSAWGVALFTMGFLALIIYLFAQALGVKKAAFYTGISCLIIGLACLIAAVAQYQYLNKHQEAILFTGAVNVKSEPNPQAKTLFVIQEGLKVRIAERHADWLRIALPNGDEGWIVKNDVKEI